MTWSAALVGCVLLLAACSDDDDSTTADPDLFEAVADPFAVVVGDGARLAPVVEAGCHALEQPRSADSAHFAEYLHALFAGDPTAEAPGIPPAAVDDAFLDACADFDGDAAAFVADVAGSLELDAEAFASHLAEACRRFREREAANGQQPFGALVADVLAAADIADADARAAIDEYCGQG